MPEPHHPPAAGPAANHTPVVSDDRMPVDDCLFGPPGAEYLDHDPDQAALDYWTDGYDKGEPFIIEQFTVVPTLRHLPSVDQILEWITEYSAENGEVDEGWTDHVDAIVKRPEVERDWQALLVKLADLIGYRMADRHVANWHYHGTDDTEPVLDSIETVNR